MYIRPTATGAVNGSEYKDCTVRAFANAGNIPYAVAHEKLADAGRIPRKGSFISVFVPVYLNNGFELFGVYGSTYLSLNAKRAIGGMIGTEIEAKKGMTLKKFLATNPEGSYIAIMRGHAFAIVEGDLVDTGSIKENTRICILFKKV